MAITENRILTDMGEELTDLKYPLIQNLFKYSMDFNEAHSLSLEYDTG
jgi:hypothetical protein